MHRNWPCQVIESYLVRPIAEKPGVKLTGFPQSGRGDRSLFCDLYDRCLNLAAAQDWESFNCQNCSYENKGTRERSALIALPLTTLLLMSRNLTNRFICAARNLLTG